MPPQSHILHIKEFEREKESLNKGLQIVNDEYNMKKDKASKQPTIMDSTHNLMHAFEHVLWR